LESVPEERDYISLKFEALKIGHRFSLHETLPDRIVHAIHEPSLCVFDADLDIETLVESISHSDSSIASRWMELNVSDSGAQGWGEVRAAAATTDECRLYRDCLELASAP